MVDPCILHTVDFKLIADNFTNTIKEEHTYICDICWKFDKKSVMKLKSLTV